VAGDGRAWRVSCAMTVAGERGGAQEPTGERGATTPTPPDKPDTHARENGP